MIDVQSPPSRRTHSLPTQDPRDSGYRRLRHCRYADDILLGFAEPKAVAEQIKHRLATFLRDDLKLELSPDKTLITHARTQRARFLGLLSAWLSVPRARTLSTYASSVADQPSGRGSRIPEDPAR